MTKPHIYDTLIIGGGPAGLSAGIYAGRATMDTLIIEGNQIGGQVTTTSSVANYPAVDTIEGTQLVNNMKQQADAFGVNFVSDTITSVDFSQPAVKTVSGKQNTYQARSVIIATGAQPHQVGFTGEKEFRGRGVAYCSTCDGELFSGLEVFVIGGGYAAAEEAEYLTRFARHVTVVMRSDDFTCPPLTADRARLNDNITVWPNTEVQSVSGKDYLTEAVFVNNQTHEKKVYHVAQGDNTFGMFIYVGTDPQTDLFTEKLTLDDDKYIIADNKCQTNISGVFAAGDVIAKPLRQIVTAAADGANAATSAEVYVTNLKKALHIPIQRAQITKKHQQPDNMRQQSQLGDEPHAATQHQGQWFDQNLIKQLQPIFDQLSKTVILSQITDNSDKSHELSSFLTELAALSQHLTLRITEAKAADMPLLPHFTLLNENNAATGIAFSGIPTGHELNSLVLALYNVAGPGQKLDTQLQSRIKALPATDIKVGVSLTCHFCPDVVAACQHIAALNPHVSAEMIDLQLFPDIRNSHHIMSVPAMMIDDQPDIIFGSQTMSDIVTAIENVNA